jgi:hypothetical protein
VTVKPRYSEDPGPLELSSLIMITNEIKLWKLYYHTCIVNTQINIFVAFVLNYLQESLARFKAEANAFTAVIQSREHLLIHVVTLDAGDSFFYVLVCGHQLFAVTILALLSPYLS